MRRLLGMPAALLAAAVPLLTPPALAQVAPTGVDGVVRAAAAAGPRPVEGARVEVYEPAGSDVGPPLATVFTNSGGRFSAPEVTPPVLLVVRHPRFDDAVLPVPGPGPVEIDLVAKRTIYEDIVVSETTGGDAFAPAPIASTVVDPLDVVAPPSTLLDVVDEVPGVAENGQGGLFQVFSIRGISRQRVLTLISGMQVTSERRAGVSTSFVDPLLLGSVDVLRGPASSYYGSGALGGVVQVFPEAYDTLSVRAGYEAPSDEVYQRTGWGSGGRNGLSAALAARRANDGETPDGERIHSGFEQVSATLRKRWGSDTRAWELLALPSEGRDIAKANTDFPERTTDYPDESHLLVKASADWGARWSAFVYGHPQDLETRTERTDTGQVDRVLNDAFDFGGDLRRQITLTPTLGGRLGLDYFGRRSVDAVETEARPGSPTTRAQTLDGGEQDEASAYGSLRRTFGRATVEAGGRYTHLRQQNDGDGSRSGGGVDDDAWTGFAGAVVALPGNFELSANVGTGLRFPNLSERFFTGTTGRGEILANRDLDPESSRNTDLRLAWFGRRLFVEADVFRNEIDDYIERVEITDDILTFVNLTTGTLTGFEFEGSYQATPSGRLSWGGHTIDGEDDTGTPLADVPADRLFVSWRQGPARPDDAPWSWALRLEQRADKDDPGSGEVPIPAATLLSATVSYQLTEELALSLSGGNLLDETYRTSADDKVPFAEGRSLALGVAWRR
jgi:outer membrane receptor protein involved in Fe transport